MGFEVPTTGSRIGSAVISWLENCDVDHTGFDTGNEFVYATWLHDTTPHSGSTGTWKLQWRRAGGSFADVGADTEICWGTGTSLVDGNAVGTTSGCQTSTISMENEGDNTCNPGKVDSGGYLEIQWALGFGSGAVGNQEYEIQAYDTTGSVGYPMVASITTVSGPTQITGNSIARIFKTGNITRNSNALIVNTNSITRNSNARIFKQSNITRNSNARIFKTDNITRNSNTKIIPDTGVDSWYVYNPDWVGIPTTNYTTIQTLSFENSTTGDFLILAGGQVETIGDVNDSMSLRVQLDDNINIMEITKTFAYVAALEKISCLYVAENLTPTTHTVDIDGWSMDNPGVYYNPKITVIRLDNWLQPDDYKYSATETEYTTVTSGAWYNAVTLTITPTVTENWLILGNLAKQARATNTLAEIGNRINYDSGSEYIPVDNTEETGDNYLVKYSVSLNSSDPDYFSEVWGGIVSVPDSTKTFSIEAISTGAENGYIKNARLLALRLPAFVDIQSTENITNVSTNTDWTVKSELEFTPPEQGNYLLLGEICTKADDVSSYVRGWFSHENGTNAPTTLDLTDYQGLDASDPAEIRSLFGFSRKFLNTVTQTFQTAFGNPGAQTIYSKNSFIVAIPLKLGVPTYSITRDSIARIKSTEEITRDSLAQIKRTESISRNSNALIVKTNSITRESLSRIYKEGTLNRESLARVYKLGTLNRSSLSRIFKNPSLNRNSLARIFKNPSITRESRTRIQFISDITRDSSARIFKNPNITRTSNAKILGIDTNDITRDSLTRIFKQSTITRESIARIQFVSNIIRDSLARIFKTANITRTSNAIIWSLGTNNITRNSFAQIKRTENITRFSNARIVETNSINRNSNTRIVKPNSINRNSNARIIDTKSITRESIARIQLISNITRDSNTRIFKTLNITRTSLAKILGVATESIARTSNAQIKRTESITRLSNAMIKHISSITRESIARIKSIENISRTSIARIFKTAELTRLALAQILRTEQITRESVARIKIVENITRNSDARIFKTGSINRTSNARIIGVGETKSITRKSNAKIIDHIIREIININTSITRELLINTTIKKEKTINTSITRVYNINTKLF